MASQRLLERMRQGLRSRFNSDVWAAPPPPASQPDMEPRSTQQPWNLVVGYVTARFALPGLAGA